MDLQEVLTRVTELSREELRIVRKRAEERTPARDSGHDFDEMRGAADRLDHYAHLLRRRHDNEFGEPGATRAKATAHPDQPCPRPPLHRPLSHAT